VYRESCVERNDIAIEGEKGRREGGRSNFCYLKWHSIVMKRVRSDFRAPTLRISVQSNDLKRQLPACYAFPVCLVAMFRLCGRCSQLRNVMKLLLLYNLNYNIRASNKIVKENVGELKIY